MFKVPLTPKVFLNICNLWILLRKIVIYLVGRKFHFEISKFQVDGNDVNQGIYLYENLFTDTLVDVISVSFNSKKVYEDEIFARQDKLQFLSRESKDYKCLRKFLGLGAL